MWYTIISADMKFTLKADASAVVCFGYALYRYRLYCNLGISLAFNDYKVERKNN